MNIVSLEKGKVSININGPITIGKNIYPDLLFIGRLLSIEELSRIDSFFSDDSRGNIILEDSIFDLCIESIVGVEDNVLKSIDKNEIEAGIISTITLGLTTKSYEYFINADKYIESFTESLSLIDSIILIVSKYTSTSYDSVKKIPINELLKRFALIQNTFPNEVRLTKDE